MPVTGPPWLYQVECHLRTVLGRDRFTAPVERASELVSIIFPHFADVPAISFVLNFQMNLDFSPEPIT